MTSITIDGLFEEDFRRSIQNRLREGRAHLALERLRALLAPYAGPGGLLPGRFLTVDAADFTLTGWDALADAISRHERPENPVTGLSIAFGWPGEEAPEPDADGRLRPHIETSYYTDEAFPFSRCKREDLLEGYSFHGCNWAGDALATDTALSLEGIDDLHGALARLEAQLLACDAPDEDEIRAGSLGSCLLSALLCQAVTDHIARLGLPRPLCVMAGSSDVYPYFDAPVVGMPEEVVHAAEAEEERPEAERTKPASRYSSLSMTSIRRGKKRPVLVLDGREDERQSEDEHATESAALPGFDHHEDENQAILQEPAPAQARLEQQYLTPAVPDFDLTLAMALSDEADDVRDPVSPQVAIPLVDDRSPFEPLAAPDPAPVARLGERVMNLGTAPLEPVVAPETTPVAPLSERNLDLGTAPRQPVAAPEPTPVAPLSERNLDLGTAPRQPVAAPEPTPAAPLSERVMDPGSAPFAPAAPEPDPVAPVSERALNQGPVAFEPDLQQRLQRLVSVGLLSADMTPAKAAPLTESLHAPSTATDHVNHGDGPAGRVPDAPLPEPIALWSRAGALWVQLRSWPGWQEMRKFSQGFSATIAELRTAERDDPRTQQRRRRGLPNL